jgi:transaldolase/glucose-6-phosphate isomerase
MEPSLFENSLHYYAEHKSEKADLLFKHFFVSSQPGDYIVLQAYLPEEPEVQNCFREIQLYLQKSLHLAVSTQFGPRYLHSTGQYHKGGPNTGFFIQFICSSSTDIKIPERAYTFGLLKRAQAIGDMQALVKHNRRVIVIDVGAHYIKGLKTVMEVIEKANLEGKEIKKRVYLYNSEEKFFEIAF